MGNRVSSARLRAEESASQLAEAVRIACGVEAPHRLVARRSEKILGCQFAVDVAGRLVRRRNERDRFAHGVTDRAGEQRVMRAPEYERIDFRFANGRELALANRFNLRPRSDPCFDQFDEFRAGGRCQLQMGGGGEGVLVRP